MSINYRVTLYARGYFILFDKSFTTSEFAKIVGVSKHTLFYYDKEGVFCPERKDDNGFRGYTVFQIETFFVIKSLTDMGLTLSKIKEYLKTRSAKNCITLLEEHEKILDDRIKKLQRTKELMKEKRKTIHTYFECESKDIYIAFEEKESLYITEADEDDYYTPFTNHIQNAGDRMLNLPCAVGHIIKNKDFKNKTYFDYYFSKTKAKSKSTLIKPAGNYLNYYHKNGYFTVEEAYDKIIDYANEHKITLGAYFYEYMILDELSVIGIENYVVKISIQVIENNESIELLTNPLIKATSI